MRSFNEDLMRRLRSQKQLRTRDHVIIVKVIFKENIFKWFEWTRVLAALILAAGE